MTGVAAQWCGAAPPAYRRTLEQRWHAEGRPPPAWGARRVVLGDLSPAATFIAANYNIPFDVDTFHAAAGRLLEEVDAEIGWMYETLHTDGRTTGRINYTVWSEVFSCPNCAGEVVFLDQALDPATRRTRTAFPCPHCAAKLTKDNLVRSFETLGGPRVGQALEADSPSAGAHPLQRGRCAPREGAGRRRPGNPRPRRRSAAAAGGADQRLPHRQYVPRIAPRTEGVHARAPPVPAPRCACPGGAVAARRRVRGRAAAKRARLLRRASHLGHVRTREVRTDTLFASQPVPDRRVLHRFPNCRGVTSVHPRWANFHASRRRSSPCPHASASRLHQPADCSVNSLPDNSIDYVFTDPPFGENIFYADLNHIVESWHRARTRTAAEAIVDRPKGKEIADYQRLMQRCFEAYHRVLKPGRWITVVFHNSRNAIWNAIQEAMHAAGFVVADVRTLDKQQRSYRQVTSTAVKQDLVISAYKPNGGLEERFRLQAGTEDGAWDFVRSHLQRLPVFVGTDGRAQVIAERQSYLLFDRMVAFHVQRGVTVPLSATEFHAGLRQRFPERDGMFFLREQVAEYDPRRLAARELVQLEFFVRDEETAIRWLRQQLERKPQTFQEIHPQFIRELAGWLKHERMIDLSEFLAQNFLPYDGRGEVPSPIHAYLSTNFKELRNLPKDDYALRVKAKDRWYVPDPHKATDLTELRTHRLLREFDEYRASTQRRLKLFRLEAVRAGFRRAWQTKDYATIVEVADKIPDDVLHEDPKLLMWYDQASTRAAQDESQE